ncbi:hypothetical protein GCM10009540_26610 [Streptomyces turgidiscabies]
MPGQMPMYRLRKDKCPGPARHAARTAQLTHRQEYSQLGTARLYNRGRRTGTRSRSARIDLGTADGADGRTEVSVPRVAR